VYNCMLLGLSPSNIQFKSDALCLTVNVNIKIYCDWYTNSDVLYKHSQYFGSPVRIIPPMLHTHALTADTVLA
jgi:hypothetical protein